MMPSCDQPGVPLHFHSSTTSGSAALMSLRILLRVLPRQSPSSAIFFEISSDADWPWLVPAFLMFSSWKFQTYFMRKTVQDGLASLKLLGEEANEPRRQESGIAGRLVDRVVHPIMRRAVHVAGPHEEAG